MRKFFVGILPILILILFLIQKSSFAQENILGSTAASQEKGLREKENKEQFMAQVSEPELEFLPIPKAPEGLSKEKFFIKKINLEISEELDLKINSHSIVLPYENKELSLNDLITISDEITKSLQKAGFITSQAFVPPQKIKDDTVTIKVLEGNIGDIKVEGNKYTKTKAIKRFFKKYQKKILQYYSLYHTMQALNENPDRLAKARLIAGNALGTSDLELNLEEKFPIDIGLEVNNLGSRYTQRNRYVVTIKDNNLTGQDDIFTTRVYLAEDDAFLGIVTDYKCPLADLGTKWGISFSRTASRLGREFDALKIEGRSYSGSTYLEQLLLEGQNFLMNADLGFELREDTTKVLGARFIHDSLRILKMGLTTKQNDKLGRTQFRLGWDFGFPSFLGASGKTEILSSRQDAGGQFNKTNISLMRLTKLPFNSLLIFLSEAQFSSDKLVVSQQHRIGGTYTVRGYPEGEALGDYGFNTTIELRTPAFLIPKSLGWGNTNLRNMLQFTYFADAGQVNTRKPAGGERRQTNLAGVGTGLRINFKNNCYGRFDVAWPIGRRTSEGKGREPRMHWAFGVEF
ncbi:MAG: ShlB/FhaC/HecB family hemolysin secretion/activation protein [Candidatus Omnitrophota bacterium]